MKLSCHSTFHGFLTLSSLAVAVSSKVNVHDEMASDGYAKETTHSRTMLRTHQGQHEHQDHRGLDLVHSDFELFDPHGHLEMRENMDAQSISESHEFVHARFLSENIAGSRCSGDDDCMEDLACVARRCVPGPKSCLAKAVAEFVDSFDSDTWKAGVLDEAGVTEDSLMNAAVTSGGYDAFKNSETFQSLMTAAESSIPDQVYDLQDAVDLCDATAAARAGANIEGRSEAPTTSGTIVYMGIHFELSVIADIAASVFWSVGGRPEPRCFVRGTFGLEAGVGAEMSMLLGFAFTGTPGDIQGGGIVTDFDAGFVAAGGAAVVANLNGLVSLEFTLGVGAGGGLGVGYSITATCTDTPDTDTDAPAPTAAPAPVVLALEAIVRDSADASVADIYNAITSQAGVFVTFNDDIDTDACGANNPTCQTQSEPGCSTTGTTSDTSILPVVSAFTGNVATTGSGGCCTALSCVYSLIESKPFAASANQVVSIDYSAAGGGDWYECLLVVFKGSPPATTGTEVVATKLIRGDEIANTITDSFTLPSGGTYFVAFFTGSYDESSGGALGARLQVDSFKLT